MRQIRTRENSPARRLLVLCTCSLFALLAVACGETRYYYGGGGPCSSGEEAVEVQDNDGVVYTACLTSCDETSECTDQNPNATCGSDGVAADVCVAECQGHAACAGGNICTGGVCVDPDDLEQPDDDNNSTGNNSTGNNSTGNNSTGNNSTGSCTSDEVTAQIPGSDGETHDVCFTKCDSDSDCTDEDPDATCQMGGSTGICVVTCLSDSSCSTGRTCAGGICVSEEIFDNTGNNSTGNNSTGNNSTGNNSTGNNSTGNNSTGNNSTGNNSSGNNSTGNNSTGDSPLTCFEIDKCATLCNDASCLQEVSNHSSQANVDTYNDLVDCANTQCSQAQDLNACLAANCPATFSACFPTPSSSETDLSCTEAFQCAMSCSSDQCRNDCRQRSTTTAENQLIGYINCLANNNCSSTADTSCIQAHCEMEHRSCFGCP